MKLLRICFVSQEYPPKTGWGGIGAYVYEMSHALVQAGHQVVVLTRALEHESTYWDDGVLVYRVLRRLDVNRMHFVWRLNRFWEGYRLAVALKLRVIVREHRIDLIEGPEVRAETFFLPFTMRKRPPILIRLHSPQALVDELSDVPHTHRKRTQYWMERQVVQRADLITSPSTALLEKARRFLPLPEGCVVVPNPLDLRRFTPLADGENSQNPEVLYVGRIEWRKGPQVLREAIPVVLRHIPTARFTFLGGDSVWAGGSSMAHHIQEQLPSWCRAQVRFVGAVERQDMPGHYRRATVCVVPSLWENFPYVVLEAMACGTPVVATRTGGLPEMVEDGVCGLLVPPEDPEALAEALLTLLSDQRLRQRMGQAARRHVEERFSGERVVPQMVAAYRCVLNGTPVSQEML